MKTQKLTRLAVGTVVAALAFGNAGVVGADDKEDKVKGGEPTLLTDETAAITAGDTAWIALNWTTKKGAVEDLKITADSKDVTVSYPLNTGDHSGPLNGYTLEDGEVDYTAVKVEVPYGIEKAKIDVFATYTSGGKAERKKFKVKVPVATYDGSDAELLTESIEVSGPQMVELSYKGMAPLLDEFAVTATGPDGLYLEHTRGEFSSLEGNAQLEDTETDLARIYLDPSDLEPGTYELDLNTTYTKGGVAGSLDGSVTLTVSAAPAS